MRFPNARQLQGRAKRRTQLASDLNDTGKPKRIIVEHEVRHTHEVVRSEDYNGFCPRSPGSPGWTCEFMRNKYGACAVCPFRSAAKSEVTITHEFIDEPPKVKQLK